MPTALSIRTRALLAVALLVGFYLFAVGIAGGLLVLPYAEWRFAERVDFRILVFCGVGAFLILKALIPRPDRFEAPGPRLLRDDHPALFSMIEEVASETAQRPPAEVYLVGELNAFVTERGGTMGVGSRRVMGIGLPLLQLLSVDELRAVIAHEFGHYVSGDTRLGPWIYKTRAAIGRTLQDVGRHSALLAKPFEWYGLAFLRVTHAVSRAQEFVADATAARIAGAGAARRALVRIAGASDAFGAYWRHEVAPLLEMGYRPPIAAGFQQFLASPTVAPVVLAIVDREMQQPTSDPYDSHPSLRDRLAAIDRLVVDGPSTGSQPAEGVSAASLLNDVDQAESALVAWMARGKVTIARVDWNAVPTQILPLAWRQNALDSIDALAGLTPEQLPDLVRAPGHLARRFRVREPRDAEPAVRDAQAFGVIGCAIAYALHCRSLEAPSEVSVSAAPGEPVLFRVAGADTEIRVFDVCTAMKEGALSAEQWQAQCAAAGIAGIDLGGEVRRDLSPAAEAGGAP